MLTIPPGVAHGFLTLTDGASLVYLIDGTVRAGVGSHTALGRPHRRHPVAGPGQGRLRQGPGGSAVAGVLITGSTGLLGRHTMAAWPALLEAVVVQRDPQRSPGGRSLSPACPGPRARRGASPRMDREQHARLPLKPGQLRCGTPASLEAAQDLLGARSPVRRDRDGRRRPDGRRSLRRCQVFVAQKTSPPPSRPEGSPGCVRTTCSTRPSPAPPCSGTRSLPGTPVCPSSSPRPT